MIRALGLTHQVRRLISPIHNIRQLLTTSKVYVGIVVEVHLHAPGAIIGARLLRCQIMFLIP
jgi:hypothetical protein